MEGDVAVQFCATRDLLHRVDRQLQERIATEGQGALILAARQPNGHWGRGFYQPKWTCSHYTLLELKGMGLPPANPLARDTVARILRENIGHDGGLNPGKTVPQSDACVNGMALGYCAYFGAEPTLLTSIVDFLLSQQLPDGGFNCRLNRGGARHSSVHTSIAVIEGVTAYHRCGYDYRVEELMTARAAAIEFILRHGLYRSERTGLPMNPEFTRLHHPARWHYDILRGLHALADAAVPFDPRMRDALEILAQRRLQDGRWTANRGYPGATHLPPTPAGRPDRWITLAAVVVLDTYVHRD